MRALANVAAALMLAGVASAQEPTPIGATDALVPPLPMVMEQPSAPARVFPPASRARPLATTDEGGLWGLSDRAEQQARASGQLETDPALNAYLRDVACGVAAQYCGDVRLYVMNRPFFNASMAPNGYMEIWSGLLLRVENEAQLSFVLGHEIGHYGESHSVSALRATRNRANGALVATIGLAVLGTAAAVNNPTYAGSIGDVTRVAVDAVYLGTLASIFGFSREQENEADMIGFDHAVAAGYDPQAGAALWRNLIVEGQASDNPDVRREEKRNSIFDTHPLSSDRVEALTERAGQTSSGGETRTERYRAAIRPHLDSWLRAELRRRDFGQTLVVLDRLDAGGQDLGVVEYYRGEVYRLRRGTDDRAAAEARYRAAIVHPDAPAAAWRELADIEARAGRSAEAGVLYQTYLDRAPEAEDRALIALRMNALGQVRP
jgi:predicted Zn-dependent protease